MVLLKWGWVHQRIPCKFRPATWKKRYLVLTTMSIHVHRSEKGVISSLFHENMPDIHVWSNFQAVKSYQNSKRSSKYAFVVETRDPQIHASLKFKCPTTEEKEKWIIAIDEQLKLTRKMWSSQPETNENATSSNIALCKLPILKQQIHQQTNKCTTENPPTSVSVLDKWLEQLNFLDAPPLEKSSSASPLPSGIRNLRQSLASCSEASNSKRNSVSKRSSSQQQQANMPLNEKKAERRISIKKKRIQNIISNY